MESAQIFGIQTCPLKRRLGSRSKLARAIPTSFFEELVVDEAQDVLREEYVNMLDLSIRGGFGGGRWRLFGDFSNASIYSSANMPLGGIPHNSRAERASLQLDG